VIALVDIITVMEWNRWLDYAFSPLFGMGMDEA
jgi:hypothetical protein